jgi:hypothetical protein
MKTVIIGLPPRPRDGHFAQYAMARGATTMQVTDAEAEFLERLSLKLKRSGSPVWLESQVVG